MSHSSRDKYEAGKGKSVDPYPLTPEQEEWIEAAVAQADVDIDAMRAEKTKKQQIKTLPASKAQQILQQVEDLPDN